MSIEMENQMNNAISEALTTIAVGFVSFLFAVIVACLVVFGGFFAVAFMFSVLFGAVFGIKIMLAVAAMFILSGVFLVTTGVVKNVMTSIILGLFDKLMKTRELQDAVVDQFGKTDEPEATTTAAQPA